MKIFLKKLTGKFGNKNRQGMFSAGGCFLTLSET